MKEIKRKTMLELVEFLYDPTIRFDDLYGEVVKMVRWWGDGNCLTVVVCRYL